METLLGDAMSAARNLLGWKLVHVTPEGRVGGYIVETEAYDEDDPASHAFGGERVRNAAMFKEAGTIYVYFTYGMHYCVNIVTGRAGRGEGVLIRALEPVEGIDIMQKRRDIDDIGSLTNGPAKLVQALGITKEYAGQKLGPDTVFLEPGIKPVEIVQTTRVGISKAVDFPNRFFIKGNRFVSKPASK